MLVQRWLGVGGLLGASVVAVAQVYRRGAPLARLRCLPVILGLEPRWWVAAARWITPADYFLWLGVAWALGALLFGVLLSFAGWMAALGGALLLLVLVRCGALCFRRDDPPLAVLAGALRPGLAARAAGFRAKGQRDAADAAALFQARCGRLLPGLALTDIDFYTSAPQLAAMLEDWAAPSLESNEDDLRDLLRVWLQTPTQAFWQDSWEQGRVALLERVRQELLAGGGLAYRNDPRVAELVAELRAYPPAA
jgi:hypothetical protein